MDVSSIHREAMEHPAAEDKQMTTIKGLEAGTEGWAKYVVVFTATGNVQVAHGSKRDAEKSLKFYGSREFSIVKLF